VLVLGAATLVVALLALIGVGHEESYELLLTFTFYGIAYLALFAIPIFSRKERGLRAPLWLRLAACSGMLVTLLFIVLSVFPIIDVGSSWQYSLKIAGVVIGANTVGWVVFQTGSRKTKARTRA
jgi:hypothetical protein